MITASRDSRHKPGPPPHGYVAFSPTLKRIGQRGPAILHLTSVMPKQKTMASPSALKPFDKANEFLEVVIETPKGSRNKFKYDPDLSCYRLNSVLPEGLIFPYDFGFVPGTRAQDGDPVDVLLLMDVPAFPGIVAQSRIVGVIEAQQTEDGKTIRNDRVIAVAKDSYVHSDIKKPSDLNSKMMREVEQFFVTYNKEHGKSFKILGVRGAKAASRLIKKSIVKNGKK